MTKMTLRLPERLHEQLGRRAEREGVSLNQLVVLALTEMEAYRRAEEHLRLRAARAAESGDPMRGLHAFLAGAPEAEPPDERDRM